MKKKHNKIRLIITKSNIEGYNYMYIFIGKHIYVEYDILRYLRVYEKIRDINIIKRKEVNKYLKKVRVK